jgi:N-acetylmuramoyl-L-alanine amidase
MSPSVILSTLALAVGLTLPAAAEEPAPAPQPPTEAPLTPPAEPTPPVEPAPSSALPNLWRYIVIHHSASPSGNAASFHNMHRRKGWDGLAYHFVITNGKGGPDGGLEVGFRWWRQQHGAHAGGLAQKTADEVNEFNEFGIGICLVGNFEHRPPTKAQMKTLAWLVKKLQTEHGIASADVVGHRHVKSTACPGRQFPWKTLFAMLEEPAPTHLVKRAPIPTSDRCPWCFDQSVLTARAPGALPPTLASRSMRVPARTPIRPGTKVPAKPAPRLLPGQPSPDVPPPTMLTGQ